MAGKAVWLATNGLVDNFECEGARITRAGTKIDTESLAKTIEDRAAELGVAVTRLEQAPVESVGETEQADTTGQEGSK